MNDGHLEIDGELSVDGPLIGQARQGQPHPFAVLAPGRQSQRRGRCRRGAFHVENDMKGRSIGGQQFLREGGLGIQGEQAPGIKAADIAHHVVVPVQSERRRDSPFFARCGHESVHVTKRLPVDKPAFAEIGGSYRYLPVFDGPRERQAIAHSTGIHHRRDILNQEPDLARDIEHHVQFCGRHLHLDLVEILAQTGEQQPPHLCPHDLRHRSSPRERNTEPARRHRYQQ